MNLTRRPGLSGTRLRSGAVRAGAAGVAATVLLSGCSMSWASMSPAIGSEQPVAGGRSIQAQGGRSAAAERIAVPASVTTQEAEARVTGDLDTGSTTHRLDAGGRSLVIDYWTEQDPASWTADRAATIRLAAHVEDADSRHAIKVSRFGAVLDDGVQRTLVSEDRGEFVVTPPYSYGGALTLPELPSRIPTAEVAVQFDLLIETEPGSGSYFRQTVLDTLRLSFATTSEVSK
jgi:hypothetical protein